MKFENPDLVEYFSSHRQGPDDLYPSEGRFLEPLARKASSVLDVGCAAGGFASIWRTFKPDLSYTGVDVGTTLIERAREIHPDCEFLTGDAAAGLPLPAEAADVVSALGWLHWEPRWREALRELWRLTGRALFFDVRVHPGEEELAGEQRIAYLRRWDGESTTPYIVASWPELARRLVDLGPRRILCNGYWGPPSETVVGIGERVCFATFVLLRNAPGPPALWLDVPLSWPDDLAWTLEDISSTPLEEAL